MESDSSNQKQIPLKDKLFHCSRCEKSFRSKIVFSAHLKIHSYDNCLTDTKKSSDIKKKPISCYYCHQEFENSGDKKIHTSLCEARTESLTCRACGKYFSKKDHLVRHEKIHKNSFISCSVCGKECKKGSDVTLDKKGNESERPDKCKTCNQAFLKRVENNGESENDENNYPQEISVFKCPICSKEFTEKHYLSDHLKRVHVDPNSYVCKTCGKGFKRRQELFRHTLIHRDLTPFECSLCGKGFRQRNQLLYHQRMHYSDRPFKCTICCKKFARKGDCKRHIAKHKVTDGQLNDITSAFLMNPKEEIQLSMSTADVADTLNDSNRSEKTDSQKQDVEDIVKQVVDGIQKPYVCPHCTKTFRKNSNLMDHLATHSENRPFDCSACGKTFKRKQDARKHMRYLCESYLQIHPDERPVLPEKEQTFSCDECSRIFKRRPDLLRHILVHSADKPYNCSTCGKGFRQKNQLVYHERSHSGQKPFKCAVCSKSYARKGDCLRHISLHIGRDIVDGNCINYLEDLSKIATKSNDTQSKLPVNCDPKKHESIQAMIETLNGFSRSGTNKISRDLQKEDNCGSISNAVFVEKVGEKFVAGYCILEATPNVEKDKSDASGNRIKIINDELFPIHKANTKTDYSHKKKSYECLQCSKVFHKHSNFIDHQSSHSDERPYQCSACNKLFKRKKDAVRHIRYSCFPTATLQVHSTNHYKEHNVKERLHVDSVDSENMQEDCSLYDNSENTRIQLNSVLDNCHCTDCGRVFTSVSKLLYHKNCHETEKDFYCTSCGSLTNHESCFIKMDSFSCKDCSVEGELPTNRYNCPHSLCTACITKKDVTQQESVLESHTNDISDVCVSVNDPLQVQILENNSESLDLTHFDNILAVTNNESKVENQGYRDRTYIALNKEQIANEDVAYGRNDCVQLLSSNTSAESDKGTDDQLIEIPLNQAYALLLRLSQGSE